jgi:hypothetical protein
MLPPKIRFDDIKRDDRPVLRCGAERSVIVQTQVALEPHHL